MGCCSHSYVKLAAIGIWASICHANNACTRVLNLVSQILVLRKIKITKDRNLQFSYRYLENFTIN